MYYNTYILFCIYVYVYIYLPSLLALNGGGRFLSPSSPLSSLLCSLVSWETLSALLSKLKYFGLTGLLMQLTLSKLGFRGTWLPWRNVRSRLYDGALERWRIVCLAALSVEDIDIYLFGTMITGILLIGLGFTLGYRRIQKTGTAVQRPFASVRFDPLAWSSGSDQRRISGCGIRWLLAGPDSLPLWLCRVCAFVLLRCFSCSHTVLPKEHSLGVIFFSSLSSCKCCIFLQFYLHFTTDYTCMIVYVTNNKEPWTLIFTQCSNWDL